MLFVTNQRYRCPACDNWELLKSAYSVCTQFAGPPSWRSHFLVVQPESDISQKCCRPFENPKSTVWIFPVPGWILRFDYLQSCISTANLYESQTKPTAGTYCHASFSIGRNRKLWSFFLIHRTLLMLFLSLGCLFINCRNQISAVFLYRPKP